MTAICTLFERDYSKGLGALLNSLVLAGYSGSVYAGYRGDLPGWFQENLSVTCAFSNSRSFTVQGIQVHFILLQTDFHFTNYKPFFLSEVISTLPDVDRLIYFDPDIVLKCKWEFLEQWISAGVAVVHEIVIHDMHKNHPRRAAWVRSTSDAGFEVNNDFNHYVNAGFVGLDRTCFQVIDIWKKLIEFAIDRHDFNKSTLVQSKDPNGLWHIGDQDLFNLALMYSSCKVSAMGPEAMDFIYGGMVMSHCTGNPKPWQGSLLFQSLKGNPPKMSVKQYWNYASNPVRVFSEYVSIRKRIILKMCSFIGRFYKR